MFHKPRLITWLLAGGLLSIGLAALSVPNELQLPGTQPNQVAALETPNRCDNCHGGYDAAVEPAFGWRGSMMGNASRDPIFWATLAIAEQDFPGAGDLCIRCHSVAGWQRGKAVPSDGSGLTSQDADGVECDSCHKMTNPDWSEYAGTMLSPHIANDRQSPATGYYGSGMVSLWPGGEKLGPYANANPPHTALPSAFHRSKVFCGSCHDVSNSVVGDLAHNRGAQPTADPVAHSGVLGSALATKAAFRNFPFMYGIVERTQSEFMASALSDTNVSAYNTLPTELKAGAVQRAYQAALLANQGGNYEDGTVRKFTCQSCHMRPTVGKGCNKSTAPVRKDLPLHDMTGGNAWAADAILHQNAQGTLRLGGGLNATQISAIQAGKLRAIETLQGAASLSVTGNTLKVVNLTGHKLITGYPEGRRMWVRVRWIGPGEQLLREDGAYGDLNVTVNGVPTVVKSILDLDGTGTRIYEAHYGLTQQWAAQLIGLGYASNLPLRYDRLTGNPELTLGMLANQLPGHEEETFHFVLNNTVLKDNRIPPYGMNYEIARKRNALPVPPSQYGNPGPTGTYRHWDEIALQPPVGAIRGDIQLVYQATSWEYIQFLLEANTGQNVFLMNEGVNMYNTWRATGMAEPIVMATATWNGVPITPPNAPTNLTARAARGGIAVSWSPPTANPPTGGYVIYRATLEGFAQVAEVNGATTTWIDSNVKSRTTYTYMAKAWNDANANGAFNTGVDPESVASNTFRIRF